MFPVTSCSYCAYLYSSDISNMFSLVDLSEVYKRVLDLTFTRKFPTQNTHILPTTLHLLFTISRKSFILSFFYSFNLKEQYRQFYWFTILHIQMLPVSEVEPVAACLLNCCCIDREEMLRNAKLCGRVSCHYLFFYTNLSLCFNHFLFHLYIYLLCVSLLSTFLLLLSLHRITYHQ